MKLSVILFSAVLLMVSCETKTKKENQELKEQITLLQKENEAYKNNQVKLSATIQDYRKFLNQINKNLKDIDLSSSMVGELGAEINKDADVKSQIRQRLQNVQELIQNSKLKIIALDNRLAELRRNSKDKGEEILQLESELNMAIVQLIQKEEEYLKLSAELEEQVSITEELREILNRAYYYAGNSKNLVEMGVVEKEGGFIGLGRVKVLDANAPDSLFHEVMKDKLDSLEFKAKSIELISNHPEDSYTIKSKNYLHKLYISDREKFWSQGNYLVVQKND